MIKFLQLAENNFDSFLTHLLIGFFLPMAVVVFLFDLSELASVLWIVPVITFLTMINWHHESTQRIA